MERQLRLLARAYGIQSRYHDIWGNEHRTSEEVTRKLLSALGVPASNADQTTTALTSLRKSLLRLLPPVKVVTVSNLPLRLPITLNKYQTVTPLTWRCALEDGTERCGTINIREHSTRTIVHEGESYRRHVILIAGDFPLGYHRFTLELNGNIISSMTLIVCPECAYLPEQLSGEQRHWGLSAQLYNLSSERNWGIGDFSDLLYLADYVKSHGGSFVGLNPLHALSINGFSLCSPYSASSRSFLNVLYLDLEKVPELSQCPEALTLITTPEFSQTILALKQNELIDYSSVLTLKLTVVSLLYRHFIKHEFALDTVHSRAFKDFCHSSGEELHLYALFEAIAEVENSHSATLRSSFFQWAASYQDRGNDAVRQFERDNEERINFYKYLQWLCHTQITKLNRDAALPLGLYLDLALGSQPGGADVWADRALYALTLDVGCPPDDYNPQGQNWGFSPYQPRELWHRAYRPFIQALRATMKYAGVLRIDHVMSLYRLYCIPHGVPLSEGAYIRYPMRDLFSLVSLESVRNKTVVVGEDLGTVPPLIQQEMKQRNIFSYKVLIFMKDWAGRFIPSGQYPEKSLVTTTTHDMATIRGFWELTDLHLRHELNLWQREGQYQAECERRERDKRELLYRLREESVLASGINPEDPVLPHFSEELFQSIVRFVSNTKSQLLALPLEDLFFEAKQVNLPGVFSDYPSWQHRHHTSLQTLGSKQEFATAFLQRERSSST